MKYMRMVYWLFHASQHFDRLQILGADPDGRLRTGKEEREGEKEEVEKEGEKQEKEKEGE